MDATLQALGNFMVEAIPTVLFFLFLYFFLKQVFFRPIARILDERRRSTEGVKALSEAAFANADQKAGEFERALDLARQEISAENEKVRQLWVAEAAERIAAARADAESQVSSAAQQIKAEIAQADIGMEDQIENLVNSVMQAVLQRRAA